MDPNGFVVELMPGNGLPVESTHNVWILFVSCLSVRGAADL